MVPPVLRAVLRLAAILAVPFLAMADPPARVGRLSFSEGDVVFRIDRQDEGSQATANWPISSGASLATGPDGRAEVQIGANTFRLAGGSRVEFSRVDDDNIILEVSQGSLAVTVRDPGQADELEVATPAGRIDFGGAGHYRIDVVEGVGDTLVSSRLGSAYVHRPDGELGIPGGRRAVVYAGGGWFLDDLRPDAFDAWSDARDRAESARRASRYVSPQMTGYEDLDRYGEWTSNADYGAVWYPRAVPADWAPYRFGRWAWVPPWGWTWIDAAPWGFAPFHYGRWLFLGGRWAWVPGRYTARPVYAPALVAWVGNPGWSVSFGFGEAPAVGWFPLAPREVFLPAYRCSPAYVRRANVGHVSNPAVIEQILAGHHGRPDFVHRHLPQAVTVVPADTLRSGQIINPAAVGRLNSRDLVRAPVAIRPAGHGGPLPAAMAPRPAPGQVPPHRPAPGKGEETSARPLPHTVAPPAPAAIVPSQPRQSSAPPNLRPGIPAATLPVQPKPRHDSALTPSASLPLPQAVPVQPPARSRIVPRPEAQPPAPVMHPVQPPPSAAVGAGSGPTPRGKGFAVPPDPVERPRGHGRIEPPAAAPVQLPPRAVAAPPVSVQPPAARAIASPPVLHVPSMPMAVLPAAPGASPPAMGRPQGQQGPPGRHERGKPLQAQH